ncbi:M48 family metallopeptidase [Streptomyces sp. NPDC058622]|uniref:M48 family metallopeptidase n=1 Tax=Streptomyces sp. NPDC058622 TaxID=3346562 RepID=UPI00365A3937
MTGRTPAGTTSRALLGCALLAGVHLLAVAVLATQLLLVVAVLTTEAWPIAVLGSLTVLPVATLALGLLAGTSAGLAEGPRVVLSPQQQPELWALTLRLAGELGTAPPTTLRLADTVNASAGERGRLLGLIGGPRTLDLGLPLLLGLTTDELRGVLCHELGHYAGRHTRLAAVSHRGSVALERTVRYLEVLETDQTSIKPPVRLLLKLTKAYNGVYLRQTLAVRRGQELEADAAAARTAGAGTFARALRTVHALAATWDEFTEDRARTEGPSANRARTKAPPEDRTKAPPEDRARPESPPASAAGKRGGDGSLPRLTLPDGVFRDFADRLADPVARPFADGGGTPAPHVGSGDGLGSHPPLEVRLAALRADGDMDGAHRPTVSASPPAAALLRDLPELALALQDALRPVGGSDPAQGGATVSVEAPRPSRAFLRFKVKTLLIGMVLVLTGSVFVHTVISPPRTDPPPFSPPRTGPPPFSPPPGTRNVRPEASLLPPPLPTSALSPLPPPGRATALPLLPGG